MQPGFRFLGGYYGALARLLRAGLPLPRAALSASKAPAALRAARALEGGVEPEAAFKSAGFPSSDAMVIGAGAVAGRLDAVLDHLSGHYERLAAARRAIVAKSLYPLLVIHLAAVLLAIPPAVLAGDAAVFWTRAASTLAALYLLGAAVAAGCVLGLRCHAASPAACVFLESIPLIGGWLRTASGARFASVFALLVRAGAGPLRGLEAAGKACRNARLAAAALRAAEEGRRGEPLAAAFRGIPPSEIARALELGQTSGRLDAEMEMAARALEAAAGARLEAIAEWLPRILYLGILAYVGWRIVATAIETGRAVGEALDPGF